MEIRAELSGFLYFQLGKNLKLSLVLIFSLFFMNKNIISQGAYKTLNFDGVNDHINLGDLPTDNISALSIEAWVYRADDTDDRIVCKSIGTSVSDHTFSLGISLSNTLRIRINGHGNYDGVTVIPNNTWNHVAFTYSGDSIKIYLNGILESGHNASLGNIESSSQDVIIGNVNSISDRYLKGHIDEVRIWKSVRTENEIRTYMCRGLNEISSDLIGYYRLNSDNGNIAVDETGNNNGTLVNMSNEWIWSGAPVGDNSAFDYIAASPTPFAYAMALISDDGDTFTAMGSSGTYRGIQLYLTNSTAQRAGSTIPENWSMSSQKFWGVFSIGTNTMYNVFYNYNGHPGIINETDLALCARENNTDNSWSALNATLNENDNTLQINSQSNCEYALGSKTGANLLPVELVSFNAETINEKIVLTWMTATEIKNHGFEILRSINGNDNFETIGFINGHGNSNTPKTYKFEDQISVDKIVKYKLKQIDSDGTVSYSKTIEVAANNNTLVSYNLSQNYPNPFNPTTKIAFQIPTNATNVKLSVFDLLGNTLQVLVDEQKESGKYEVEFNAENLSNGVYFYELRTDNFREIKKMLLLK